MSRAFALSALAALGACAGPNDYVYKLPAAFDEPAALVAATDRCKARQGTVRDLKPRVIPDGRTEWDYRCNGTVSSWDMPGSTHPGTPITIVSGYGRSTTVWVR